MTKLWVKETRHFYQKFSYHFLMSLQRFFFDKYMMKNVAENVWQQVPQNKLIFHYQGQEIKYLKLDYIQYIKIYIGILSIWYSLN